MVEQRIEGESELSGLANFSRWYYGRTITAPDGGLNGTYTNGLNLLGTNINTILYVGMGNSVIIDVNFAKVNINTPPIATDIVALDLEVAYSGNSAPTSLAVYRTENTGSSAWVGSTGMRAVDISARPHEFVDGVTVLNGTTRVYRLWNYYFKRGSIGTVSEGRFIIRDIASADDLWLVGHFVPYSFDALTSPWVMQATNYIQTRVCYGGNARSH